MGIAWFRGLIVRGRVTKCAAEACFGGNLAEGNPKGAQAGALA